MQILRFILIPFSLIYGFILWIRNKLFDWGVKRTETVNTAVISIGNLSVGGTGKSPHVQWIADQLKGKYQIAILSRGYGRKSKGFVRVSATSKSITAGDEALYYKTRFKDHVEVAVCEKRAEGARRLIESYPKLEAIVLDDAYQHRYLHRDMNILLTDYSFPFHKDFVLPAGRLREFRSGKNRADAVIVTKCPDVISEKEKSLMKTSLKLSNSIDVYFSKVKYGAMIPFGVEEDFHLPEKILLVAGIANPQPLKDHLSKIGDVEMISFSDHHDFTTADILRIHKLFDTFAEHKKCIVTTSKDFVRLKNSIHEKAIQQYPWFYQEITVDIDREKELVDKIELHVRKNK
jgi:tetraacyldisaccharide 4'-kinase